MTTIRLTLATMLVALCAGGALAADAKHVWTLPTYLAEGLKVGMETKATDDLLTRAAVQCLDEACKASLAKCKADMANCVLVPSREAVRENENENN